MAARVVIGFAIVGLVVAGFLGLRLVTADAPDRGPEGSVVPVPGGVLIQDGGVLLGAVGVSGDTSDNDEMCAVAGIEAAGLKANAG